VDEISRLYAAQIHDESIEDEVLQYPDYAEFQHELREEAEAEQGRAYWRERGNYLKLNNALPLEIKSFQRAEFEPKGISFVLDSSVREKIQALSEKQAVSMSNFLLACWQQLLWCLNGEDQIVVGHICDGRNHEILNSAIGLFCRQLPGHCYFEPNLGIDRISKRVAESIREDARWQDYFELELIHQIIGRSPAEAALPYSFEFEPWPRQNISAGVKFSFQRFSNNSGPFKLKLSCADKEDGLVLTLFYDPTCFRSSGGRRLAHQLETLIRHAAEEPRFPVGSFMPLDQTERHHLLIEWNDSQTWRPLRPGVDSLIDLQGELRPDATAVIFESEHLTYGGLIRLSNQLSHFLRALGVGMEARVALCLERSTALVVSVLGIIKSGGVCVALDPAYPKDRLAYILEDTQPLTILTQASLSSLFPEQARIICLDQIWSLVTNQHPNDLYVSSSGENLAYVVYTSGSTGGPKGVMVRRKSVSNYVKTVGERLGLTTDDVYLHTASVSFSASFRQMFVPLAQGCRLVMATEAERKDPLRLTVVFQRLGITIWDTVPSFLKSVFDLLQKRELSAQNSCLNNNLRLILTTGEVLFPELVATCVSYLPPGAFIVNLYGQSETTGTVIMRHLPAPTDGEERHVQIGRPLANTLVYLLNARLTPVPIGAVGELHTGGVSSARGYLDCRLTAERFVPDPFSEAPGARIYKTGDLARYMPNGQLGFVGRNDDQVKIRGMRVQLSEVESVLNRYHSVQRAVLVAREDVSGDERLIAYLTLHPEQIFNVVDVRKFLSESLPDYMIPSSFVLLDTLPLTPTGKVDRGALPEPDRAGSHSSGPVVAPRTPLEKIITTAWMEALNAEQIGVNDNFFDLGGHSILVTKVLFRLRDTLQVELSPQCFFEAPTVAGLAEAILQCSDQPERVEKMAEIIVTVAQLSESEVRALLEVKSQPE